MEDVYVTVVGGGVCGVLAAQRFRKEGLSYKIIEKENDYGGVWAYRANDYSHLQAYAALYAWDLNYRLDENPFKKCPSSTVLNKLRNYATEFKLREHTQFGCTVTTIKEKDGSYLVTYEEIKTGKQQTVCSKAVFICCGILGKQLSVTDRSLPHIEAFTGLKMFAGKQEEAQNYLREGKAKGKDVVILGSGAFGLEAMEAAQRSGAKSITLITRDRDRWIVPYSEQFRFIVLSHCPFLPRRARCALMESWLHSRYKACGMEHMVPSTSTPQNFTGQCNDAFFQYAKEGKAKYIVGKVKSFKGKKVELESGEQLHADILVTALGHELQKQPAFMSELGVGFTTDLHNFAFLGKNPYLGGASDWVWFNVPHGPQKQIDSFVSAQLACRSGREAEVRANLLETLFVGCKGEPLNFAFPSGMHERRTAYWRTLSAGLPWYRKAALAVRLYCTEWQVWLLCAGMCIYESISLGAWLRGPPAAKKQT